MPFAWPILCGPSPHCNAGRGLRITQLQQRPQQQQEQEQQLQQEEQCLPECLRLKLALLRTLHHVMSRLPAGTMLLVHPANQLLHELLLPQQVLMRQLCGNLCGPAGSAGAAAAACQELRYLGMQVSHPHADA